MDAVEFVKARDRMLKAQGYNTYSGRKTAEQIVDEVEKWEAEHPIKTRQSAFLEQWPDAELDNDGVLGISPCSLSTRAKVYDRCAGLTKSCKDCRREFWMQEVE